MNVQCERPIKNELITKAIGLILFAVGVELITRANYGTAMLFLAAGGFVLITPFFCKK